jgi:hypothetical protein
MCRIAGVSIANRDEKLDVGEIAACLFPEMVRQGPHAYGWMTYNEEENEITSAKFVGRSDTDDAWNNIIQNVDPVARWGVFHTRFATHGDPKDLRNDHPIKHGKIIGVHNGILRNHEDILAITGREDPKTQVDSEAIFAAVNKWGPTKGLRRIQGDMVTVFANIEHPRTLRIGRTFGRQLTIGFTVKGNMIFCSDQAFLRKLEPEIKFDHFTTISENRLLVVKDGKITKRSTFRAPSATAHAPRRFVPPPRQVVVPHTVVRPTRTPVFDPRPPAMFNDDGSLVPFDEWHARRQELRAARRGETLFPKNGTKKKGGVVQQGKVRLSEPDNGETYYHDGILMTKKEFEETIESLER